MKKLSVILPIHEYNDTVKELFERSVYSYLEADLDRESELLIITTSELKNSIETDGKKFCRGAQWKVLTTEQSDFCSMVNYGATQASEYFSILEYDDVYWHTWFDNVQKQIDNNNLCMLYLPLCEIVDNDSLNEIGYANEAVWASSFSDEIGFFDNESIENYLNFNVTGGIFKTSEFLEVGGLKPSMKHAFWYEFLRRAAYKGKKIYVVPKVGYKHVVNRPGSLSMNESESVSQEEMAWWIDLANKDYFFLKERDASHYVYNS